jgi:small multidrug resistance family-3 protein
MHANIPAFLGVAAFILITPGPDTALVTKNALVYGRRAGLATSFGVASGLLVWTLASALGIAAVVHASATAYEVLKLIGGAYLIWLGIKDHRGVAFVALGAMALAAYGVVAAFQPSHEFGRVLAAYGGVFIVGSLLWGIAFDGFRPDRADLVGAAICLAGVGVIMYAR